MTGKSPCESFVRYYMSLEPINNKKVDEVIAQSNPQNVVWNLNKVLGKENWTFEIINDTESIGASAKTQHHFVEIALYMPSVIRTGRSRWKAEEASFGPDQIGIAILDALSTMQGGTQIPSYSEEDIAKINRAKVELNIKSDAQFLDALKAWNPQIVAKNQLLPEKIDEFLKWMYEQFGNPPVQPAMPVQNEAPPFEVSGQPEPPTPTSISQDDIDELRL